MSREPGWRRSAITGDYTDSAGGLQRGGTPKSRQTRADILEAAAALFSQYGYAGTSLEAIAKAVSMRQGSLYYYFTTKESLAAEVLTIGLRASQAAVVDAVEKLPDDATFGDRLTAAVRAHLYRVLASDDFSRANLRIFYQLPPGLHAEQLVARDGYARWWLELVERAATGNDVRTDCDLHVARMMLLGAMNWSIDWFNPRRGDIDHLVEQFVSIFLGGIGARAAEAQNEASERSASA